MTFTLEEIYNCTRVEYCNATGTSMQEMADRYKKEVDILKKAYKTYRSEYRRGAISVSDEQRKLQELLTTIEKKIIHKIQKIKEIESFK